MQSLCLHLLKLSLVVTTHKLGRKPQQRCAKYRMCSTRRWSKLSTSLWSNDLRRVMFSLCGLRQVNCMLIFTQDLVRKIEQKFTKSLGNFVLMIRLWSDGEPHKLCPSSANRLEACKYVSFCYHCLEIFWTIKMIQLRFMLSVLRFRSLSMWRKYRKFKSKFYQLWNRLTKTNSRGDSDLQWQSQQLKSGKFSQELMWTRAFYQSTLHYLAILKLKSGQKLPLGCPYSPKTVNPIWLLRKFYHLWNSNWQLSPPSMWKAAWLTRSVNLQIHLPVRRHPNTWSPWSQSSWKTTITPRS